MTCRIAFQNHESWWLWVPACAGTTPDVLRRLTAYINIATFWRLVMTGRPAAFHTVMAWLL